LELVKDVLTKSLKCSIFVYGQTGAGKTYTLSGGALKKRGLAQETIRYLYTQGTNQDYSHIVIECWMIQVYKSDLVDLLKPED